MSVCVDNLLERAENLSIINEVLSLIEETSRRDAIIAWFEIGILPEHAAELLLEVNGLGGL